MASYHDLSDFQHDLMGHIISKIEAKFGFLCLTISRVYHDYKTTKPQPYNSCVVIKRLGECDQHRLARIISHDRRATLPQVTAEFNARASTNISMRTLQRSLQDMGFRSRHPTQAPLKTDADINKEKKLFS
uniref:Transposase Tc1-like domain-containing protein n=1 Tax=Electrophorus electricus TaxID=8005 RepID=A0A4W4GTI2_ELEEL